MIGPLLAATLSAASVTGYNAHLEVRIATGWIGGRVDLAVRAHGSGADRVSLDAGEIIIERITIQNRSIKYTRSGASLVIELPAPLRRDQTRHVEIAYHVEPRRGVRFSKDAGEVYTVFSTSQWLPCHDSPAEKATLDLSLHFDRPVIAVGSGEAVGRSNTGQPRTDYRWVTRRPVSTYVFGFGAGPFTVASETHARIELAYYGAAETADELRRIFRDTGMMIDFFAEKAGVAYGERAYTQVLAAGSVEQEVEAFTLLSSVYGRNLLADPSDQWLQAHELAHQWWGNGVTCASWNEFWLNEAMATFMADAWKEHRYGRETYLREIELSRARYERVRDAGQDHALVYSSWDHPTAADRVIVYHKGAYVLHLLREQLGDEKFWSGLRAYTRTYTGKTVTTRDFQEAMERASGIDLAAFFARWVYPPQ